LLHEERNAEEKRKKYFFKCKYQSVVRLLRSQPANSALSSTEEKEKNKLPAVKLVPVHRVGHVSYDYMV
jgi:hypothetical protein